MYECIVDNELPNNNLVSVTIDKATVNGALIGYFGLFLFEKIQGRYYLKKTQQRIFVKTLINSSMKNEQKLKKSRLITAL